MFLTNLPNPVYYVPGNIFKQLYPSSSMDLIYAFQVFNQLSKPIYASDHLLSTLSHNPDIRSRLSFSQDLDLSYLLNTRYKELCKGGDLLFDVLITPDQSSDPYSWDCLDLAVQLSKSQFSEDQQKFLNLHPCFRSKNEVLKVLFSFKEKFTLTDTNESLVSMPAYDLYLETENMETYANELIEF